MPAKDPGLASARKILPAKSARTILLVLLSKMKAKEPITLFGFATTASNPAMPLPLMPALITLALPNPVALILTQAAIMPVRQLLLPLLPLTLTAIIISPAQLIL